MVSYSVFGSGCPTKIKYAGMAELAAWRTSAHKCVKKRVRQGSETRRIAIENEQGDYVSSRLARSGCPTKIKYAGMAELADA